MEFSSAAAAVGLGLALDVVEEVLGVLAEIEGAGGRAEEGLSLLTKALTHVHKTGEQYYEAELYRLKRRTYFTKISSFAKSEGKGRP